MKWSGSGSEFENDKLNGDSAFIFHIQIFGLFFFNWKFKFFEKLLELKLTKRDEIWKIQLKSSLLVAGGGWSVVEDNKLEI